MEKLKIIFLEEGESKKMESFNSDAKEIAEWIKKVLTDFPKIKIFMIKSDNESNLLKVVREEVPEVCVQFIEEKEISETQEKCTNNIICAVLCVDGKILGTPVNRGTSVPANYFFLYSVAKKLAEHINDF